MLTRLYDVKKFHGLVKATARQIKLAAAKSARADLRKRDFLSVKQTLASWAAKMSGVDSTGCLSAQCL